MALFRLKVRPPSGQWLGPNDAAKEYLERLVKMIPGEVVGLYLVGAGFIPPKLLVASAIWTSLCLLCVVIVRVWGTADPKNGKQAQPVPVFVACIAFVIWVYTLGGPFALLPHYTPWIGSLATMFWSFIVPIFYKGPDRDV